MTPETKGQPEPVAWMVVGTRGSRAARHTIRYHKDAASALVGDWQLDGFFDSEARPLYDYDVPALMERREKLVEALAVAEEAMREAPAFRAGEPPSPYEVVVEALAAAREES